MSETGGSSFRPNVLRPIPQQKPVEQKLREAAESYEKMFLREMVKSMRSTVGESGLIKQNPMEKMFREELDAEHVGSWGSKGGVGMADLIYNNLIDRFGPQLGLKPAVAKPVGPIALDKTVESPIVARVPSARKDEMMLKLVPGDKKDTEILSPWKGLLLDSKSLGDDLQYAEIQHDNGLTGRITWKGSAERLKVGQSVEPGEKLGLLSTEAQGVFWGLREDTQSPPSVPE